MNWRYFRYWLLSLLFKALRSLLFKTDEVVDSLFSYSFFYGSKEERKEAESKSKSLHRVKIILRWKHRLMEARPERFIWSHQRYMDNEEFTNIADNTTLFGITKDWAIFAVTQHTAHDMWNINNNPFMVNAQWAHAEELILMPINEFNVIGDQMGDPKSQLAFLYSIGRTGSTIIGQILNKAPNVQVFAEPWSLMQIHSLHQRGVITQGQKVTLLQSAIRIICSKFHDVPLCVLKLSAFDCGSMEDFAKLFPKAINMFSCRTPSPCIKSFWAVLLAFNKTMHSQRKFCYFNYIPFPKSPSEKIKQHMKFMEFTNEAWKFWGEQGALLYVLSVWHYKQNKSTISHVIHFEELIDNPQQAMGEIFDILDIPREYLGQCLTAMNRNSQEGQFKRASKMDITMPPELIRMINKIFDIYDFNLKYNATLDEVKQFLDK